jgi:hypothetical protein
MSCIQIFIRCTKGKLEKDLLELQRRAVKKIAAPVPALPQLWGLHSVFASCLTFFDELFEIRICLIYC